MTEPLSPADFVTAVHRRFPGLPAVDESAAGLLHLEVARFRAATQHAIDRGDRATVTAHLAFVADAHRRGDDVVTNALGLTYLGRLGLRDGKVRRAWAIALFPAPLLPDLRVLRPELFG